MKKTLNKVLFALLCTLPLLDHVVAAPKRARTAKVAEQAKLSEEQATTLSQEAQAIYNALQAEEIAARTLLELRETQSKRYALYLTSKNMPQEAAAASSRPIATAEQPEPAPRKQKRARDDKAHKQELEELYDTIRAIETKIDNKEKELSSVSLMSENRIEYELTQEDATILEVQIETLASEIKDLREQVRGLQETLCAHEFAE